MRSAIKSVVFTLSDQRPTGVGFAARKQVVAGDRRSQHTESHLLRAMIYDAYNGHKTNTVPARGRAPETAP